MHCSIRPMAFKPPRLIGLSERLLADHYESDYGGALRRLGEIRARLAALNWAVAGAGEIVALKREELAATNAIVLHEAYFDSLGGADGLGSPAIDADGELADAIARDFGSLAIWREQFTAMGRALAGGSGWVTLNWSVRAQGLENQCIDGDASFEALAVPLIALDMYAHAYAPDFGADAAAYVDAYMANLHWGRAARRYSAARAWCETDAPQGAAAAIRAEALRDALAREEAPQLLDVCLADDLPRRRDKLPGAQCWQAGQIGAAIAGLSRQRPVVAYCMYGFQVSAEAAETLRREGFDARILAGGISAWRAIGGPTVPYDS